MMPYNIEVLARYLAFVGSGFVYYQARFGRTWSCAVQFDRGQLWT